MKKSKPKRLLTPKQMAALIEAVKERDGGCIGRHWPGHVCKGKLAAHHVIEQSWIKLDYSLGGRRTLPDTYAPIDLSWSGYISVDITASEIAADPLLCVCLCEGLHKQFDPPNGKLLSDYLTPKQRATLAYAAKKYAMLYRVGWLAA